MRRTRITLLYLVLAFLTTIATAWIAAILITQPSYQHYKRGTNLHWNRAWEFSEFHNFARNELNWVDLNDQLPWPKDPAATVAERQARVVAIAPSVPQLAGVTFDNTAPSWSIFAKPEAPAHGIEGATVVYGFPFPCLEYSVTCNFAPNVSWGAALHDGFRIKGSIQYPLRGDLRALPLRPHTLPFILNTAFYAIFLLTLAQALPRLRAHLRRRRNLCPSCAYNRQGLPPLSPCPECGRT